MKDIIFIDSEISSNGKICDLGAVKDNNSFCHTKDKNEFKRFISNSEYVIGHNIIDFDLKYISDCVPNNVKIIDTLFLSPLLFPKKPYHSLVKDDKIYTEDVNNPLSDAKKAKDLFYNEVDKWNNLFGSLKNIFGSLLEKSIYFKDFLFYCGWKKPFFYNLKNDILRTFRSLICENSNLDDLINNNPIELAYALSLIYVDHKESLTPFWVIKRFPKVETIIKLLRGTKCKGCPYCNNKFDAKKRLKEIFNYDDFRKYGENEDEPLQEDAVNAAIKGESLLAIFPTGGGKSLTFQLPALIDGETSKALTVVISPLQSLMKDQVDNLENKGIIDSVTINGLLDHIERKKAIDKVREGIATILYISPESLRSKTIENLLLSRNVTRFVIDEAHCFSSWGQDFRVDYLYIGEFIRNLQEKKGNGCKIAVSCFTATAKQKVISDIRDYFKEQLGLDLHIFATNSSRKNLKYQVINAKNDDEKDEILMNLIKEKKCPTIIYVSTAKTSCKLADKLTKHELEALPFNGKMDSKDKVINQDAFIKGSENGGVDIMVATSAFGMGVDKANVGLVVHYEISDSLENYVQEAGRAGRDPSLNADCYVLFNEKDLDTHFGLLTNAKLTINEIQNVWRAIKKMTKGKENLCCSALDIAKEAGYQNDEGKDIETRIKTAINALESSGYLKRGQNSPRVFASGIKVKNYIEACNKIDNSSLFNNEEKQNAKRIVQNLISQNSKSINLDNNETRIDYLANILGIDNRTVVECITKLRQIEVLADTNDMILFYDKSQLHKKNELLSSIIIIENYLLENVLNDTDKIIDLKQINDEMIKINFKKTNIKILKIILNHWANNEYIEKNLSTNDCRYVIKQLKTKKEIDTLIHHKQYLMKFAFIYFKKLIYKESAESGKFKFSINELINENNNQISLINTKCSLTDMEDALYYLQKIGVIDIDGGFLVIYNKMQIRRKILDNNIQYKKKDYEKLSEYYKLKIQQIHIVGRYANMMVENMEDAKIFVKDYFGMDYKLFIKKYFKGHENEINKSITSKKYHELFDSLSDKQREIIDDEDNQRIAVIAGPGSGKTRVLVHKLAALLTLEDVKSEQLLMLTFSRAAAIEFKDRLHDLIGDAAYYVDIKTFHSYCFDLIGRIGNEADFDNVIPNAIQMIENGEVENEKITKSVIVIDEAQDMTVNEYNLINTIIKHNDNIKVIAVGDDDQNIYEFRHSDSKYMYELANNFNGKVYELLTNYRSCKNIIDVTNQFANLIKNRFKKHKIEPIRNENGNVTITKCISENLEEPIVNDVIKNKLPGKTAILTRTNEQASKIFGLLIKNGSKPKLIDNDDSIKLINCIEIKFFISKLDNKIPVISDENWNQAKASTTKKYEKSSNFSILENLWKTFETKTKTKYYCDFINFVLESEYSDFIDLKETNIVVSTIHKSKGHEFDNVFILLDNLSLKNDEEKRKIYVGMTRAKNNLHIYINNDSLNDLLKKPCVNLLQDNKIYNEPNELKFQLTLSDVNLSSFKDTNNYNKKERILNDLIPGMKLKNSNNKLIAPNNVAFYLSKAETEKINKWINKGYIIYKSIIRNIVSWIDKDDIEKNEWLIILPEIYLRKENINQEEKSLKDNKLTNEEKERILLNKLKEIRKKLANEKNVPAFVIFDDKTLLNMVEKKPLTLADFLTVKGVGNVKAELYGQIFIDEIKKVLTRI